VLIGAIAGYVAGAAFVAILFSVGCAKERVEQHHKLRRRFGRYWSLNRTKQWKALAERISPGQCASGEVACVFYYGVFVDTGHGFPGLLTIGNYEGGIYATQAAVGTCVSARVFRCDDTDRFIELTHKDDSDQGGRPTRHSSGREKTTLQSLNVI
jgi:hypothetical protein